LFLAKHPVTALAERTDRRKAELHGSAIFFTRREPDIADGLRAIRLFNFRRMSVSEVCSRVVMQSGAEPGFTSGPRDELR